MNRNGTLFVLAVLIDPLVPVKQNYTNSEDMYNNYVHIVSPHLHVHLHVG